MLVMALHFQLGQEQIKGHDFNRSAASGTESVENRCHCNKLGSLESSESLFRRELVSKIKRPLICVASSTLNSVSQ